MQHRRLYPDADEPKLRMSEADIALDFVLEFGGSAYLSTRMVIDHIKSGELFPVKGAQLIDKLVYAIFPVRSDRAELIHSIIEKFEYRVSLPRRRRN